MRTDTYRLIASATLTASGIGVAIAGFCVPPLGEISDSVLMFTAEALVMAGAFVGIDVLVDKRIANRLGKAS
jgi:hypothetical protein